MKLFLPSKTLPDVLAIDEFKGNAGKEKYQCILTNTKTGEVLYKLLERYFSYLSKCVVKYTRDERRIVKYFISDMWSCTLIWLLHGFLKRLKLWINTIL